MHAMRSVRLGLGLMLVAPAAVTAEPAPPAVAVGLYAGPYVPRTELSPGVLVGGEVGYTPPSVERLIVFVDVDWVRLARQDSMVVSPPIYPRSRTELIQTSDVLTAVVGARWTMSHLGAARVVVGAGGGAVMHTAHFLAYGRTHDERDVTAAVTVLAGVRSTGRMGWAVDIGWRQAAASDLGAATDYGAPSVSGLVAAAQVGLRW